MRRAGREQAERLVRHARAGASPPLPSKPVATVEVPIALPVGESRVSKIEVGVAPRFQITWRTPSAVRARPSWTPGWVGPLILDQGAMRGAARPARG